jgi:ATP-dependent Clp protease ATP-binding subunit ClpC
VQNNRRAGARTGRFVSIFALSRTPSGRYNACESAVPQRPVSPENPSQGDVMFERFTDHAQCVLRLEGIEAQRMHHDHLGTEHMLIALIREPEGHGHRALERLGLDLRHVRQAVHAVGTEGPQVDMPDALPQTEHFKHVMQAAVDEARKLGAGQVGTEHLLLALLKETDGVAMKALQKLRVKPQDVRDKVLEMIEEEQAAA